MKMKSTALARLAVAAALAASMTGCAVVPMAASALGSAGASSLFDKMTGGRSIGDAIGFNTKLSSKSFGEADVKKVKKGKTGEAELKKIFGDPAEDFKGPDGRVLIWRVDAPKEAAKSSAAPSGLIGVEKRAYRQLTVRLDASGKADDLKYEPGGLVK